MAQASSLQEGDDGAEVSALQLALAALGFGAEDVSGFFGEGTTDAVRRFQESQGVDGTGVVDETTWELLGRQPFNPTEKTQISAQELPSIARAIALGRDIDAYLADLGVDASTITDDDEPVG